MIKVKINSFCCFFSSLKVGGLANIGSRSRCFLCTKNLKCEMLVNKSGIYRTLLVLIMIAQCAILRRRKQLLLGLSHFLSTQLHNCSKVFLELISIYEYSLY